MSRKGIGRSEAEAHQSLLQIFTASDSISPSRPAGASRWTEQVRSLTHTSTHKATLIYSRHCPVLPNARVRHSSCCKVAAVLLHTSWLRCVCYRGALWRLKRHDPSVGQPRDWLCVFVWMCLLIIAEVWGKPFIPPFHTLDHPQLGGKLFTHMGTHAQMLANTDTHKC